MNVFFLDRDVRLCARYHCDAHVLKMQIEYAQLLSGAVRSCGIDAGYRATHINHPCAIWTRQSISHFEWIRRLAFALEKEWRYRYRHPSGRTHAAVDVIRALPKPPLPNAGWTDPPQAMPEYCRRSDSAEAYREYYRTVKSEFAVWTRRETPP